MGTVLAETFRLLTHLGSGGMGDVYEAEHLRLGSHFAVKFLRAELSRDSLTVRRFEREARALAMLHSAHLVTITDTGVDAEGVPFFVMEYLGGADLRQLLDRYRTLAVPRAVRLMLDAASGLRVVHAAGLVHGDVKPANLFVTSGDMGEDVCKVLDFGLVRARTERAWTESPAGTVRYMAPEQLRDGAAIDQRADIRALGAVLYECLLGRPPHVSDRMERVIYAILNDPPASLRELGVVVPEELDRVILKALAREPSDRYQTVDDLIGALSPFSGPRAAGAPASRVRVDDTTADLGVLSFVRGESRQSRLRALAVGTVLGATLAIVAVRLEARDPAVARPAARSAPLAAGPREQASVAPLHSESLGSSPVHGVSPRPEPVASAPVAAKPRRVPDSHRMPAAPHGSPRGSIAEFDVASPYGAARP